MMPCYRSRRLGPDQDSEARALYRSSDNNDNNICNDYVQTGHQTGRHHQRPGAEAGQAEPGDSDAGDPDQGAAHAGDQASGQGQHAM